MLCTAKACMGSRSRKTILTWLSQQSGMTLHTGPIAATLHLCTEGTQHELCMIAGQTGLHLIPRLVDEIPVLAVAAACADGVTEIHDAQELKVKESNRLETIAQGLRAHIFQLNLTAGNHAAGHQKIRRRRNISRHFNSLSQQSGLSQMGARIIGRQGNTLAPLAIEGTRLQAICYQSPVASAPIRCPSSLG